MAAPPKPRTIRRAATLADVGRAAGVSAMAAGQNASVFALPDWQQGAAHRPAMCDGRMDGMELLAPLPDDAALLPEHTPFVAVHANHALPCVANVESDEEAGADRMVRHLLTLGHRRLLHLGGPLSTLDDWLRRHRGEPQPDAIFAASDAIALGCLDTLHARRLQVAVRNLGAPRTKPSRLPACEGGAHGLVLSGGHRSLAGMGRARPAAPVAPRTAAPR